MLTGWRVGVPSCEETQAFAGIYEKVWRDDMLAGRDAPHMLTRSHSEFRSNVLAPKFFNLF